MYKHFFKRILDFIITLLGFICISPFFLILCILVRCKLGSPVFFIQVRIGKDEKPFKIIKFRTMTDARDKDGNNINVPESMTYKEYKEKYLQPSMPTNERSSAKI